MSTTESTTNASLNGEPFSKKDIINTSLRLETANIIGTSFKGPAFVPQILSAFALNNIENTVSNKFGTRIENQYKVLKDGLESKSNSQAFKAADLWFLNGGQQCSFTRVLGIGNGELDSTKGTYKESGFIVSDLEYKGPKYFKLSSDETTISELTYSGGDYKASINFLIIKLEDDKEKYTASNPNTGFIDFRSNYLEDLGITDTSCKFISDTFITPKGVFSTLNDISDNGNNDSEIKNTISDCVVGLTPDNYLGNQSKKKELSKKNRIYLNGFKGFDENKKCLIEIENNDYVENNISYEAINSKNYFHECLYEKGHSFYTSYNIPSALNQTLSRSNNDDLIVLSSKSPSSSEDYIDYNDFNDCFQKAKTPWITSQPINRNGLSDNRIDMHLIKDCIIDLFRFHALDDGESGNRFRIKVCPRKCGKNKIKTYSEFDIHIFEYKAKINNFNLVKSYISLDLDPDSEKYIGRVFGTQNTYYDITSNRIVSEGIYPIVNDYFRVEIHDSVENKSIPTNAIPSGFRAYPHIDFQKDSFEFHKSITGTSIDDTIYNSLDNVKMMPLQYVRNYFKDSDNLDISNNNWGVLFDITSNSTIDDSESGTFVKRDLSMTLNESKKRLFQRKINSSSKFSPHYFYTKYFQKSMTNNNVLKEDDSFLNSYFNIEKVIYPTNSDNIKLWEMSLYKRSGKRYTEMYELPGNFKDIYKYVDVDEILDPDLNEGYETDSRYLSFDLFTYGGFDGVNIFDNDSRFLNNNSIVKESEAGDTGPTYFSYKKAIELATDYSNCDGDILIVPGIRERKIVNQCIDICESSKRFIYISDVSGRMLSGNMITTKKDLNGNVLTKANGTTESLSNQSVNKLYYTPERSLDVNATLEINREYRSEIENNFSLIKSKNVLRDSRYYVPVYNEVIDKTNKFVIDPSVYTLCHFAKTLNLSINIDDISIFPDFNILDADTDIDIDLCDSVNLLESRDFFNKNLISVLDSGINCIGNLTPDPDSSRSTRLLSANTTFENRKSLFRQASNVRIINLIRKALKIDLFTSERFIQGGVLFSQNSKSSGFYSKVKLQIDGVLNNFKNQGVIKDFLVKMPSREDDRTIEEINNYILRGNIFIQFNKDDSDSIIQMNLTDLLSEFSLLTSSLQDVIITV